MPDRRPTGPPTGFRWEADAYGNHWMQNPQGVSVAHVTAVMASPRWIVRVDRWRWPHPMAFAPSFNAATRWANRWAHVHADRLSRIGAKEWEPTHTHRLAKSP